MRSSTIFGIIMGLGVIYAVMYFDNSTVYFLNWQAFAIVFGGTISSMIIYFSPFALRCAGSVFIKVFTEQRIPDQKMVDIIVYLSRKARHIGFIELYTVGKSIGLPFLEKGLMLLADGAQEDALVDILRRDSETIYTEHKTAERFFRVAGSFSPLFGMLGTVMGLISMLNNIKNPAAIPSAMGLALVTTFFGLVLSALFFKPIAGKIKDKNDYDNQQRKIIIEGILAIKKGENSQRTKEKLATYVTN